MLGLTVAPKFSSDGGLTRAAGVKLADDAGSEAAEPATEPPPNPPPEG